MKLNWHHRRNGSVPAYVRLILVCKAWKKYENNKLENERKNKFGWRVREKEDHYVSMDNSLSIVS